MYEYIKGTYVGINKDYVIVECGGIGYRVYTSGSTMSEMPKINDGVILYLEQIVREDFIGLYGFLTKDELNMFKLLLTINGIGAKAALSLLSIATANNLKYAILQGEENILTKAPGVGKKTAQRIILELKDKIKPEELINFANEDENPLNNRSIINLNEALEALIALGYSPKEAEKAISRCSKEESLEDIIKESLKYLMG
ncbi:Holliday junction branch migration protein RuvA [Desnuesiella massiliensis]|uniref:Holliday junction branch migration protein RuvA n=1 Tax=Desnuesiella massiliensis TaxID=1650662 RepID=UPI0006E2639E|nr:Holliday junction branch migration protein RuvA [Desnuesiella massiliensis]